VVEDYQANHATLVKAKAEWNAKEIIIEAATKISLKVGASCVILDASGVTIAGPTVKINSGGFGTDTGNPAIEDPLDAEAADTGEPGYLDRPRPAGGGSGRRRRTLASQHAVTQPRPGEDPRMARMRRDLANSPTGRHSLEVLDRYNIPVRFDTSDGYYYDPGTNTITMNPNMDPDFQTTGLVHESNHGQSRNEGNQPNASTMSRQDYIDASLREEAHGDALANQARREMAAGGHTFGAVPTQSQPFYDAGYNQGVANAQAANPNATPEELDAAGRAAGEQAVQNAYNNGQIQTSTPGNPPYPQFYGSEWDRINGVTPSPGGATGPGGHSH
jgi:hypothetical protein